MTPATPPNATPPPVVAASTPALPASLVLLLAGGAGLSVASLYYAQPMLGVLGADMHVSAHDVGLIPTLTQLGYALGILLLAPLGDRFDRRSIILGKAVALCAALGLAAAAPTIHALLAASLCIGLAATLAQDLVPAAATPVPRHSPIDGLHSPSPHIAALQPLTMPGHGHAACALRCTPMTSRKPAN